MYENSRKETSIAKNILLEFLEYLKFKIESDRLTMHEADSIARVIQENIELTGTADDFSEFYKKPKCNIHVVLSRKMLSKPKRRVLYSFNEFRKRVPTTWKNFHLKD